MNCRTRFLIPLHVLALLMSLALRYSAAAQTPPYAAAHPLPAPVLFAEGRISTPDYELTTTFTPDGRTAYFTLSTPDYGRHYWILDSHFEDGHWSAPRIASFSGRYSDADPFISPDGTRLYYLSKRPVTGTAPKDDFDMWMVERRGDGWSEPIHLGDAVNTDRHELFPTVTADGTLYYTAYYDDSRGAGDLYRARLVDGRYTTPENLGDVVNGRWHDSTPYIAPDESYLIFASWRPDGPGAGDLYISYNRDGAWTPPVLLPEPISSAGRDYCPIASPDGRYLFFASARPDDEAITSEAMLDYDAVLKHLHDVRNGLGNVYQVDMETVQRAGRGE